MAAKRPTNDQIRAHAELLNVEDLAIRLMEVGFGGRRLTTTVSELDLIALMLKARDVFLAQPLFLELDAPVTIVADIHGQYPDLLRILNKNGFPPDENYLFLGDYVDRGRQNLETISLVFCYKVLYPENIFLLRGNHELASVNRVYGFLDEIQRRFKGPRLWNCFQDVFSHMPLVALTGGRILSMHGGISQYIESLDTLRQLPRIRGEPPNPSLQTDLLWADPERGVSGYQANSRGVSSVFGEDVVLEFCRKHDIDLIVRGHQVVQDGYQFFADRHLVTLFSAPHYCGQFDNAAATIHVDENLQCTFDAVRLAAERAKA